MKEFLKEIYEMLNRALDSEKTDADENFCLLYEIRNKLLAKLEALEK